ncbi:reverse transcriptase domain-containing protein [Kribbella sp. GL6]|uniref:reverse transcriptase domain-containing protein n=1 Tax=Kribbella sp. GL6 TaxID=3419765 RepID=UPI003D078848
MAPSVPLFEFTCHQSIASLEVPLGKPTQALERLAATCDTGEAYKTHSLWVRRKLRDVSVPNSQLDLVHRRINSLIFPADLAMRKEVNGFVARRSTITNALPHIGAKYLQKFDIKDFFTNIRTSQVQTALCDIGFGTEAATMISRLVSCNGRVPLGARTSPRISNLILGLFDDSMIALAAERKLVYSRYADDLSFSAQELFDVSGEVRAALASSGFELNASKTKSFKLGQPMFVTGLAISDELRPRLRKRFKSRLRREFYFVEKYGLVGHADEIGAHPERTADRLIGQFYYAKSVEPEFATRLKSRYPNAFRDLIPQRTDSRVERAQRHRQEFLTKVRNAPAQTLPFYTPTASLPLAPARRAAK